MRIVLQKNNERVQKLSYSKLSSGMESGVWVGDDESASWDFDPEQKTGSFASNPESASVSLQ